MEPGYPCPDAVSVDTCDEVATMSERGVECKGRGTIPSKGHLDPLLLGGGISQDENAHQPVSPQNFSGRSEARDISLIRGNARQSCARPSVPLKMVPRRRDVFPVGFHDVTADKAGGYGDPDNTGCGYHVPMTVEKPPTDSKPSLMSLTFEPGTVSKFHAAMSRSRFPMIRGFVGSNIPTEFQPESETEWGTATRGAVGGNVNTM